jgi:hypothetical protein
MDERNRYKVTEPRVKKAVVKPVLLGGVKVRPMPEVSAHKTNKPKVYLNKLKTLSTHALAKSTQQLHRLDAKKLKWQPKKTSLPKNSINTPIATRQVSSVYHQKVRPLPVAVTRNNNLVNKFLNLKPRIKQLAKNKKLVIGISSGLIVIMLVVVIVISGHKPANSNPSANVLGASDSQTTGATQPNTNVCPGGSAQPKFKLIFPKNKKAEDFGGVCLISAPTSAAAFKYHDTVGINNTVSITEQQLPDTLNTAEKLSVFAKDNYYSESLDAGGTKVYLGTSAKGVQYLVFTKNDLLVFIQSDLKQPNATWITYVAGLQ